MQRKHEHTRKLRVVVLGGGTGLSLLLRGAKWIPNIDLSAIVSVSDDGGSTGKLRDHFTIPAVGDLRKVIASLSHEREELRKILDYRFANTQTDLDTHTIGNLIILSQILNRNSFSRGVAVACKMLNVQGRILPVSNKVVRLVAEFKDKTLVEGESNIKRQHKRINRVFYNDKHAKASAIAVKAIKSADLIVLGIGSLYTSLIPNLLYPEIRTALKHTNAFVCYFANLFTEPGETDGMDVQDHVSAIEQHTFPGLVNTVVVNNKVISSPLITKYADANQKVCSLSTKSFTTTVLSWPLSCTVKKMYVHHDVLQVQAALEKIIKGLQS